MSHGGRARRRDPGQRSAQRPSERRRSSDPARLVAYETLRAISDGAYANLELPGRLRGAGVRGRDAAFATELVYGATRMRGLYDAVVDRCAGRPLADIDPPVLDVLRLGVHQLLGMRVPAHAAVDATVGLARAEIGAGASSFINAVLRRVAETDLETWLRLVAPDASAPTASAGANLEDLSVATSHPAWIVRALRQALLTSGASTPERVDADLVDLLHAHNRPADVALVARPGLAEVAELVDAGATPGLVSPLAAVLRSGGDPGSIEAVRSGRAGVQDEGSQLVVLALLRAYDATRPTPGPGGGAETGAADDDGPRWLDL